MIDALNPFPQLRQLFTDFLGVTYGDLSSNEEIPTGLRELYRIKECYARQPEARKSLFDKQDRLLLAHEIDLTKPTFDFLIENQSCWRCDTEKGKENPPVFTHSAESIEIEGRQQINDSLNRFLTTYALMELSFFLPYNINDGDFFPKHYLQLGLKVEELWMKEPYAWHNSNRYSFWRLDDDCLLMDRSITLFATTNKEKLEKVKRMLGI